MYLERAIVKGEVKVPIFVRDGKYSNVVVIVFIC